MSKPFYAMSYGKEHGIYWSRNNFEHRCPGFGPISFNTFADAFYWITGDDNDYVPPDYGCRWSYSLPDGTPIVFTDGSAFKNGPDCQQAGYGIFWGRSHRYNICAALNSKRMTSPRAELMAAIVATEQAYERGFTALHICTDSTYAIRCGRKMHTWQDYGWHQGRGRFAKNIDLLKRWIKVLDCGIDVTMEYVEAHQNDNGYLTNGNNMADWLAKCGRDMCQQ